MEYVHAAVPTMFTPVQTCGKRAADIVREHGISEQTFYRWKSKFGGMDVSEAKRLRQLEEENRRLKEMVADLSLDNKILKDVISKNV